MDLLILGGTVFLGRHLIDAALGRGHKVTIFNRGRHDVGIPPEVEWLKGDRASDLSMLEGRRWDAVIDTCGYVPRIVRASAQLLAGSTAHYTFVSSISVYADFSQTGMDESARVATLAEPTEEVTPETYGALKALCEQAVEEIFPGRSLHIRAGLIVGPYDYTNRFTYWPCRIADGGQVLAPGDPDRQIQIIDARDLADWVVRMAESNGTGVYNSTGPDYRLTFGQLLERSKEVSGSSAQLTWVSDEFLLKHEVGPWQEMPLWIPEEAFRDKRGFLAVSCDKAIEAGLTYRPLADTIKETLKRGLTQLAGPSPLKDYGIVIREPGLTPEREAELLEAWRGQS